MLLIIPLETNFSEIWTEILMFSFKKMRLKMSSGKWWPSCLSLNVLNSIFSAFGTPLMDMFATAENKVTPIYVSPYTDDRAWAVDALSISWNDLGLIYAFPPAPIVP